MVAVGNGVGLTIENTSSAFLTHSQSNSNKHFLLNNVLHCSQVSSNLLSIYQFCVDNHCYFILTSNYFCVKDLRTKVTLLEGKPENGFYPIWLQGKSLKNNKSFGALIGIKTSSLFWHSRL